MKAKSKFVATEFTNKLGQLVSPGDSVAFVSTSRKRTLVRKGIFEGVYLDPTGKVKGVRVGGVAGKRYVIDREPGSIYGTARVEDAVRKVVLPLARVIWIT
jgi:hypothetical protein